MAKQGLLLEPLDPKMHAYDAWVSPACKKKTLGQLSSYLVDERRLLSLQGWVLVKQRKLSPLPLSSPTGPGGHLIHTAPSHPQQVPDLSQLECCQGLKGHPSLRKVLSPSRTLPPWPLTQQDADRRDAFSMGHCHRPGLSSCVGSPGIQRSGDELDPGRVLL